MLGRLLLVAAGGALGASARYGTSLLAGRTLGTGFPMGTLAVNLVGCLLIGVLFSLADRALLGPSGRLFFMTGILGGLTTFSTMALETATSYQDGAAGLSLANLALNNVGGLLLVLVGMWLGRSA